MLYGYGHLPLAKNIYTFEKKKNICYRNNNKMCTFDFLYYS